MAQSTFENLVGEISTDERQKMLRRMKNGKTGSGENIDNAQNSKSKAENLTEKLKRQSLFKQFWYWLMAAVSSASVEDVYNKSLIAGIARDVEKNAPGQIVYRRKVLSSAFYERMVQLKGAAQFFLPYIEKYEMNPGGFYTVLGNIIVPYAGETISMEADPYQYPFDSPLGQDVKASLLRKLEATLEEIPSSKKTTMYASVRSVEWLKRFCKLPFERLLSQFVVQSEGLRECMFAQIKAMFTDFSRVLCNYVPVTEEALQALRIFYDNAQGAAVYGALTDIPEAEASFSNSASAEISVIRMFMQGVPMLGIARVIFEDSQLAPEPFGGGEDWNVRFKDQWKFLFERRWEHWNRDFKKERLKVNLLSEFHLTDFPLFPYRPWENTPSVKFQYELTLGFINHFATTQFPLYSDALEQTSLEGDFGLKENRVEFTDAYNYFVKVNDDLSLLANQLSASGEYGLEFSRGDEEGGLTKSEEANIASIMADIEDFTSDIVNTFGKACRSMKNLMGGILAEKITQNYGPLVNLLKIGGRNNKAYREKLVQAKNGIEHAYELVQELEPLDIPMD